ncbi:hypothetical protein Ct9H90mP29_20390 [bacterium]|nr:MAG: hypothetical protein Ct9H90mP29_20390 [bacterium]
MGHEECYPKLEESFCVDILLTDRGTQFGYNNLVADMRSILNAGIRLSNYF